LIVFNCLIGNGDAHLKNFALQYTPGESDIKLCPAYDITNTLLYPTIDNKMADEIHLLDGLKTAIEKALGNAKTGIYTTQQYRHDKKNESLNNAIDDFYITRKR